MTDLCQLPAHQLVELMAGGTVSCREVVDAHLARIDAVNPALNALVQAVDPQQCLAAADAADAHVARGAPVGRAHGLPVVVKDVMHVAGLECSGGSPVLRATAEGDATAVSRLRAEGAIVLGLTNVPEMGRGGESNNNLYGRTNNPFDLSRTPGGSSGGSAALVSAGGAALSVGSDGGGSIRQPSHNTGIAGLKPTHGRIPRTGSVFGDAFGIFGPFNCYGPLARSVPDLFLGLSIMSGPDLRDPYAVPAPLGHPADVDLACLRVATYLDDGISPPDDDIAAVVGDAVRALTGVVGVVEHNSPLLPRTDDRLVVGVGVPRRRSGSRVRGGPGGDRCDDPSEELAEFLKQARLVDFSLTDARARLTDIDNYRLEMLEFMADYDVIIGPAMPTAAKPHHHGLGGDPGLLASDGAQPDRLAGGRRPLRHLEGGAARRRSGRGKTLARRDRARGRRSPRSGSWRMASATVGCIELQAMRFGLFIPQGWRLDLVDIPPAEQWAVMRDLAAVRRRRRLGFAVGLRPLPHGAGADGRGHARGVVADVGLRRKHVADQARPDVYGDELPQPGLSGQGGRHRGHHLGRPGRRWVSAAAGTSTNGRHTATGFRQPVCGWAASTRACRSCATPGVTDGSASKASTIRSTAPSSRRSRCRRAGIPLWIAGGGEKVTLKHRRQVRAVHQLHVRPDGFRAQVADPRRALRRRRHRLRRDRPVGELQRRDRHVGGDVKERVARLRARQVAKADEAAVDGMLGTVSAPEAASGTPEQVVEKLRACANSAVEYAILYFPEAAYDRPASSCSSARSSPRWR